jgi:TetR/AcrR family transcriptional regulator
VKHHRPNEESTVALGVVADHRTPEQSRQRLVEAAFDEFAAKGYAGARVRDIADRAGVNIQLISYHFGGKAGLYREVQRDCNAREEALAKAELPLEEMASRYLHNALADPRQVRLAVWEELSGPKDEPAEPGVLPLFARPAGSEQDTPDFDTAAFELLMMAAVVAPVAMPQLVARLFHLDASSPEFEERYSNALRRMIRQMSAQEPLPVSSFPTAVPVERIRALP